MDVDPAGKRTLVSNGCLAAEHRALDEAMSKPYLPIHPRRDPVPVPVGEIIEYAIAIMPTSMIFKEGHSIELIIRNQDDLLSRLGAWGAHFLPHMQTVTHSIHFGSPTCFCRLFLPTSKVKDWPCGPERVPIPRGRRVYQMGREGQNIVVVVTLDSKGEEALYLKNLIRRRGHNALIMDIGIGGEVSSRADFTREEVALATGRTLEEIRRGARTHTEVLAAMAIGAKTLIQRMMDGRKIDGLLSIGGGLGTTQASIIMPSLPLSLPKLILLPLPLFPGQWVEKW